MIVIKTEHELEIMREAAKVTAYILDEMLPEVIKPGMTTAAIDRIVEAEIRKNHQIPGFKGYGDFRPVYALPSMRRSSTGFPPT